jgi:hypothetical protein
MNKKERKALKRKKKLKERQSLDGPARSVVKAIVKDYGPEPEQVLGLVAMWEHWPMNDGANKVRALFQATPLGRWAYAEWRKPEVRAHWTARLPSPPAS